LKILCFSSKNRVFTLYTSLDTGCILKSVGEMSRGKEVTQYFLTELKKGVLEEILLLKNKIMKRRRKK